MDLDAVRGIVGAFPGVEPGTAWGQPAFKIGKKTFACIASHRSAERNTLVVLTDFDRRAELLAEAPDIYYLTDHYVNYPSILVRLDKIRPGALRGLLAGAIQFVRKPSKRNPRKR